MALELSINGTFDMTITSVETNQEISKEEEKEVLHKLRNGSLFISIESRTIVNLGEGLKVLYTFEISVNDDSNYEFDEAWSEEEEEE